ncbi:unnamed protein product [Paramecium sonneborni]|uniref:Uncharacterized protein n=1 Tax=Paramecium sonneborni TaxID=65129 RepID=A0A8S1R5V8_9CILI|nr:unnamed protein product [Paramecium sonneborni]
MQQTTQKWIQQEELRKLCTSYLQMSEMALKEKMLQANLKNQDPIQLKKKIMNFIEYSKIIKNQEEIQQQLDQVKFLLIQTTITQIKEAQDLALQQFNQNNIINSSISSLYPNNQVLHKTQDPFLSKKIKTINLKPNYNQRNLIKLAEEEMEFIYQESFSNLAAKQDQIVNKMNLQKKIQDNNNFKQNIPIPFEQNQDSQRQLDYDSFEQDSRNQIDQENINITKGNPEINLRIEDKESLNNVITPKQKQIGIKGLETDEEFQNNQSSLSKQKNEQAKENNGVVSEKTLQKFDFDPINLNITPNMKTDEGLHNDEQKDIVLNNIYQEIINEQTTTQTPNEQTTSQTPLEKTTTQTSKIENEEKLYNYQDDIKTYNQLSNNQSEQKDQILQKNQSNDTNKQIHLSDENMYIKQSEYISEQLIDEQKKTNYNDIQRIQQIVKSGQEASFSIQNSEMKESFQMNQKQDNNKQNMLNSPATYFSLQRDFLISQEQQTHQHNFSIKFNQDNSLNQNNFTKSLKIQDVPQNQKKNNAEAQIYMQKTQQQIYQSGLYSNNSSYVSNGQQISQINTSKFDINNINIDQNSQELQNLIKSNEIKKNNQSNKSICIKSDDVIIQKYLELVQRYIAFLNCQVQLLEIKYQNQRNIMRTNKRHKIEQKLMIKVKNYDSNKYQQMNRLESVVFEDYNSQINLESKDDSDKLSQQNRQFQSEQSQNSLQDQEGLTDSDIIKLFFEKWKVNQCMMIDKIRYVFPDNTLVQVLEQKSSEELVLVTKWIKGCLRLLFLMAKIYLLIRGHLKSLLSIILTYLFYKLI